MPNRSVKNFEIDPGAALRVRLKNKVAPKIAEIRAAKQALAAEEARAAEEAAYEEALRAAQARLAAEREEARRAEHARPAAGGAGASAGPVNKFVPIALNTYAPAINRNLESIEDVIGLIDRYKALFDSGICGPLTYKLVKTILQDAGVVLGKEPFTDIDQVKRAIPGEKSIEIGTELADGFSRFHAFCMKDYTNLYITNPEKVLGELNEIIASLHRGALSRKRSSCSSCTVSGGARKRRTRRNCRRTRKIRRSHRYKP